MYGVKPSGYFGKLAELGGAPIVIFQDQESKSRVTSTEAIIRNIEACCKLADTIKTSFGPKGMDKLIVKNDGSIIVTNDGATIMKEMPIVHECARLLVELSQSQDNEIGDGTTGVVILAAALLREAARLITQKFHPIAIIKGYEQACEIAVKAISEVAVPVPYENREFFVNAAVTALNSKVVNHDKEHLAKICVDATFNVADLSRKDVVSELIVVEVQPGKAISKTELVNGLVIAKEFSHCQMKKCVEDARIAILTCPFEPPKPKTKHRLAIKDKQAYQELVNKESDYFKKMIDKLLEVKANIVCCQWGFDDEANHLLLTHGINAIRWISGKEIEMLSLVTNGLIVARFEDLTPEKLGSAQKIHEVSTGTENKRMIYFEGCPRQKAVSILVCGGNAMLAQETKRSLNDSLCIVRTLIHDPRIIAAGGASEIYANSCIHDLLHVINTSEKFIYEAFANALLAVPSALIENAGFDIIESYTKILAKQKEEKNPHLGFDCDNGEVSDMLKIKVYEALASKVHQLNLATQIVKMILRIDDVIEPKPAQKMGY